MNATQRDEVEPRAQQDTLVNGTRRSGRAKKLPSRYDNEAATPDSLPSPPLPPTTQVRPKRKAALAASESINAEVDMPQLEDFLSRVSPEERREYRGWVELESEPAFFNAMLQELGADDFKVQEVFGMDESTLDELPKPVHGLIFLYEYIDADGSNESRQDCPENLWFGNQTSANSCATVALMNIIMNAKDVKFGAELQKFKESTKSLSPPHRGHALDINDFIRAIHNSVARRPDLVSEDLLLDNKFELAEKRRKMSLLKKKMSARAASRKKADRETSYHYIAYVPVDGQVWELDGFETKPLCLGPQASSSSSWVNLASQAIQTRMMRGGAEFEFLSFNLLAVCRSPLASLARRLATSLRCSHALDALFGRRPSWTVPDPFVTFPPDRLAKLGGLTREQVLSSRSPSPPSSPPHPNSISTTTTTSACHDPDSGAANPSDNPSDNNTTSQSPPLPTALHLHLPPTFAARLRAPAFGPQPARALAADLRSEQEALEAQYAAETAALADAADMIRGRQRDYTPAVHEWVRALAGKGVLRELIAAGREP